MSSNSYASGAQQNCGNVMTDHPSTRVAKPPGGSSSFSLGWDYGESTGARDMERHVVADRQRGLGASPTSRPSTGLSHKDEIEGSKPRPFKPGIRLNAPPGGGNTFSPDWDTDSAAKYGTKNREPYAGGAGATRDQRGMDNYRYYQQEEERPGKQRVETDRPLEDAAARDTHRYYLAADNRADRVPGKANFGNERDSEGILQWDERDRYRR